MHPFEYDLYINYGVFGVETTIDTTVKIEN